MVPHVGPYVSNRRGCIPRTTSTKTTIIKQPIKNKTTFEYIYIYDDVDKNTNNEILFIILVIVLCLLIF